VDQMNGSMSKSQRTRVQESYNSGGVDVLLITKAAAEGVDLKKSRQFHLVAPTWNDALVQQAEGRTIRFKSHDTLPASQRFVDVYKWVAIPTIRDEKKYDTDGTGAARVEERLREIALRKQKLIHEYMVALQEASAQEEIEFDEAEPPVPDELQVRRVIKELVAKGELELESKENIRKLNEEAKDDIRHASRSSKRRSARRASRSIRRAMTKTATTESTKKKSTTTKKSTTKKKKSATTKKSTKKKSTKTTSSTKPKKCPPKANSRRALRHVTKKQKHVCASREQIRYWSRGRRS